MVMQLICFVDEYTLLQPNIAGHWRNHQVRNIVCVRQTMKSHTTWLLPDGFWGDILSLFFFCIFV